MTEDRREELERESETVSQGSDRWRLLTLAVLIAIPLLFAIDGPASVLTASR